MRRVQLYEVVRTAHLERVEDDRIATVILFRRHRYDFDPQLAARVGARKVGLYGAFRYMATHDVDVVEIAEPLVVGAGAWSLAAIAGARFRALVRSRPAAAVVTYAIENMNPRDVVLPWRARVRRTVQRWSVRPVWRRIDRIAFGTSASENLYRLVFPRSAAWPEHRTFEALPVAESGVAVAPRAPAAVFLGDLSERKGFPLVVAAWAEVRDRMPDARLLVVGKGAGEADARTLAAVDDRVEVIIDPPRGTIFERLAESKVLVLPSQPRPAWREQVGLPIVEGLSRGCIVVTTTETGLAEWLDEHGHEVLDDPRDVGALARAMVRALSSPLTPAEVLAPLPVRDGRRAAGDWLVEGGDTP